MINKRKTKVLVLLIIIFPLIILSQEEIEMNLVDQFHFEYPSLIIGLTYDGEYIWMSDITADSLIIMLPKIRTVV